jgi:hypothetical protein
MRNLYSIRRSPRSPQSLGECAGDARGQQT